MPSTYAHYIFGKKMYRTYDEKVRKIIDANRELYCIGLHGPDIFFYYKALKSNPVSQLGYSMHDEPGEVFFRKAAQILREQKTQEEKKKLLAYLLGFIGHFALDLKCHGYVESKIHKSGVTHSEIEVEFDRYLMTERGINPLTHRLTRHIVASQENAEVIAKVFPTLTVNEIQKSLSGMIFYDRLLLAPWDIKRKILYTGLKVAGKYEGMHGLIVNKEPNPACQDSSLRLEKLMKRAVGCCEKLVYNYLAFLRDEEELSSLYQRDFSAGPDWEKIPVLTYEEEQKYEV